MRHFITFICGLLMTATIFAQDIDTTTVYTIDEINVVGFYRTDTKVGNVLDRDFIAKTNKGQEPSFILSNMPSVFSYSDTGSEYGYSYFRMRGMDQTRVNMSMDGMPPRMVRTACNRIGAVKKGPKGPKYPMVVWKKQNGKRWMPNRLR